MKVIKGILAGALILVFLVLAIGFFLPSKWEVSRTVIINAAPEKIYPYIANLKSGWPQWSDFDAEDPNIQYSYGGPAEGMDATRSWISKKMGDGRQRITKADPQTGVDFELTMENGGFVLFGTITTEKLPEGTKVTFKDSGDMGFNPIYKILGRFMDPIMAKHLEKSLENLKHKVEANQK